MVSLQEMVKSIKIEAETSKLWIEALKDWTLKHSDTLQQLEEKVNSLENENPNLKPVQFDFCDEKFVRNSDMEAPWK